MWYLDKYYDILVPDKWHSYLQSLQYIVIDKPFLLCHGNLFENVFTWIELTDSMSEGLKKVYQGGEYMWKT